MKTSNKILLTGAASILLLIISFMLYSKYAEETANIKGDHNMVWTRIETGAFDAISMSMIDCEIIPSDSFYTELNFDKNLAKYFKPIVIENTLMLKISNGTYRYKKKPLLRIYCPKINELSLSNSMHCKATINAEKINIKTSTSSELDLTGNFNLIELETNSSGTCTLNGNARIGKFNVSTSGTVHASNLILEIAEIETSSAAVVTVNVKKSLKANASTSSIINYAGKPKEADCAATSAAKINKI